MTSPHDPGSEPTVPNRPAEPTAEVHEPTAEVHEPTAEVHEPTAEVPAPSPPSPWPPSSAPPPWSTPTAGAWPGGGAPPPYGGGPGLPLYGGSQFPPYGGSGLSPYSVPAFPGYGPPRRARRGVVAAVLVALVLVSAVIGGVVEYAVGRPGPTFGSPTLTPPSGGQATPPPNINTAAIAAQIDPAIVDIDTTLSEGGEAAGTGMVLTPTGEVLTNNHVIEDSTSLTVQVPTTGRTYSATVVGYNATDDVALIQLKGASGLKTIPLETSSNVSVGSAVVAIGNALGRGGQPDAVAGTVTAVGQTITAGDPGTTPETLHGLIETDAPIQRGDSGGPLVDTGGHVVGMDTAAANAEGGFGVQSGAAQAYAIPLSDALPIVQDIRSGTPSANVQIGGRGILGVEIEDAGGQGSFGLGGGSGFAGPTAPVSSGALVVGVVSPSPAAAAGISNGDVIVKLNGTDVSNAASLSAALQGHHAGDTVTVGWVDTSGASHTAGVRLTTGPPA